MCGRFSLITNLEEIRKRFRLKQLKLNWNPSYNIAPTQKVLAVQEEGGERTADTFTWGLVPHWAKEPELGKLINARGESVAEKPSFREAFQNNRCLIIADGFFEWKREGGGKQPYYIRLEDGSPFGFAGLYDTWRGEREELRTCTIITTQPNTLLKPIHDRMPVILRREDEDVWLGMGEPEKLTGLLKPYPSGELVAHKVSTYVNDPKNNSVGAIEPLAGETQRSITQFIH